tara:strand:- start:2102 stop:2344 length:243 start_codon:yes stop_codon:yes gene_type:complete
MIYVIYDIDNISQINFSEVFETSEATLRLSLDGTKTVLKFVGETPTFLVGLEQHNHSEILAIMNTLEWTPPQETLTKQPI